MKKIDTKGLILRIFIPTIILTLSYLMLGHFCSIPHILYFRNIDLGSNRVRNDFESKQR